MLATYHGSWYIEIMKIPILKLEAFFKKRHEIHTVLIYGSVAKNRIRKSSDIDFAIFFQKNIKDVLAIQLSINAVLDKICQKETDILILNTASPHIAFRAIKEGKIIFQKSNRSPWNQFVVKTIGMNEDLELLYKKVSHG